MSYSYRISYIDKFGHNYETRFLSSKSIPELFDWYENHTNWVKKVITIIREYDA